MTRTHFVKAASKAIAKIRGPVLRVLVTDAEEGVIGVDAGERVRITAVVVDGPEMSLRRTQLLEHIRIYGRERDGRAGRERAA